MKTYNNVFHSSDKVHICSWRDCFKESDILEFISIPLLIFPSIERRCSRRLKFPAVMNARSVMSNALWGWVALGVWEKKQAGKKVLSLKHHICLIKYKFSSSWLRRTTEALKTNKVQDYSRQRNFLLFMVDASTAFRKKPWTANHIILRERLTPHISNRTRSETSKHSSQHSQHAKSTRPKESALASSGNEIITKGWTPQIGLIKSKNQDDQYWRIWTYDLIEILLRHNSRGAASSRGATPRWRSTVHLLLRRHSKSTTRPDTAASLTRTGRPA